MENWHRTSVEQQQALKRVIRWTVRCAVERVDLAHHRGETPSIELSDGLWQSFQAQFDKAEHDRLGIRDMAMAALHQVLESTVKLLHTRDTTRSIVAAPRMVQLNVKTP